VGAGMTGGDRGRSVSRTRSTALLALAALAGACRTVPAPVVDFQPTGEIAVSPSIRPDAGAAFDARRVVGRGVDLTLGEDGRWSGVLGARRGTLEVTGDRITGPGVDLRVTRASGGVTLRGRALDRNVDVSISSRGLGGVSDDGGGHCVLDLLPVGPGHYRGLYGCPSVTSKGPRAVATVTGEAAAPEPPFPQVALALLAVLPPY